MANDPAIVTDLKDEDASAITLAENIARKSLDPIDEACAYQSRIESFGWSIDDLSKYAGTSTIHIQFRLKLLKLIPEIQKLIREGTSRSDMPKSWPVRVWILIFSYWPFQNCETIQSHNGWFRSIVSN